MQLNIILRSTVFQRVLASCAVFVVLTLAIIWTVGPWQISQIKQAEIATLQEFLRTGDDLFDDGGPDAVIDAVRWSEEQDVWFDGDIFVMLEEEDTLFAFRDPEGNILAGFNGLWASDALGETTLDHPEIDDPIISQGIWFNTGHSVIVGRFVPERIANIQTFMRTASVALIVIVLPLALLTGFFLSRGVFRRLETLSKTAETVAQGQLDARAPLTGTGDEFDRLGAGINQMLNQVEKLTRNVEAVSIGVAHDLKTPLANIGGRLELIRRDITDPSAVHEHLDVAESRLRGLLRIFDALLRMGEIESGHRRAAFQPVDLSTLCTEMAESFTPLFEDADKALRVVIAPNVTVHGDRELLAQLITNILENALEHARDAAQVHLVLSQPGGQTHLEIGDDGPGIAPGATERIFERFFRADASRATPGNGLGLSLVKAISDLHQAEITLLEGRPGAVFAITFPKA